MISPYDFFGLGKNATPSEIKKAYRLYAGKLHPDKHDGDPFFGELFKMTASAYEELADPNYSDDAPPLSETRDLKRKIIELEKELNTLRRSTRKHKEDAERHEEKFWEKTREMWQVEEKLLKKERLIQGLKIKEGILHDKEEEIKTLGQQLSNCHAFIFGLVIILLIFVGVSLLVMYLK